MARKNPLKWSWSVRKLSGSLTAWSHVRLVHTSLVECIDDVFQSIEKSHGTIETETLTKYKQLVQQKMASTFVHKRTGNYKETRRYSNKQYKNSLAASKLFLVLYQPLDIAQDRVIYTQIQKLLTNNTLVSFDELYDAVTHLPPNLYVSKYEIAPMPIQQDHHDVRQTALWIKRQHNFFSKQRTKQINIDALLKHKR